MLVIIDNGHGFDTAGKCSPDKSLVEYKYAREIAMALSTELNKVNVCTARIVLEPNDVPLSLRVQRANLLCSQYGADNCCLVSIHCNACPPNDNKWHNARGWSAWTSVGRTKGDILGQSMYEAAEEVLSVNYAKTKPSTMIRCDKSDGDDDFEANFTVLKYTKCAAVLTENLFQDNKADVEYLLSQQGRKDIVDLHVRGILKFIEKVKANENARK